MRRGPVVLAALALAVGCVSLSPYERVTAGLPPERLLEVDGQTVYVEDRGAGPAVLLVHGFGASSYSWRDVVAELESDFRVVAVDLAGFGLSERPRSKHHYSRFAQGERLLAVLDALAIDRAHLVGHSYGGSVSAALALRAPERFPTLTLVNSAAPQYPQIRRSAWAAFRPLTYLLVRAVYLRRGNVADSLRRSLADDSLVDDALIDAYWSRLTVEGTGRAFWGLTVPLRDPQGMVVETDLTQPTLLVWGEEDSLIPPDGARRVAGEIPAGRFVGIPDAGHAPMEDRPAELASILRRFFTGGLAAFD